ncbi:MAG: hypothetical protein B6I31_00065 [Desulfobacteraceae bacterium 4572_19]|nr:MAG: hypothetical protein B6I31_00065 [Desulfobacteraceae bacterium 4572_19]
MAKSTDFLNTIISNVETLGYKFTNEVFSFENVPSSRLNKAYRFELNTESIEALSGKNVDKTKRLDLFFAFKTKASKDNFKNELIAIYDLQENIEDTLLNSLINIESMVIDSVQSELVENFLIIQVGFAYTYKRSLA